jgi:cyclic beta-1,2-glucan synthetase
VTAYQRVEALTIGELWALASMLRVVLIENLRRCADRIVIGRAQREEADGLADRLLGSPVRAPESVERVLGRFETQPARIAGGAARAAARLTPHACPAREQLPRCRDTADVVVREERTSGSERHGSHIVTSLVELTARTGQTSLSS